MSQFPHGYNWQCPLCGTYADVPVADLPNYICPECKGKGKIVMEQKAIVVPKIGIPEIDNRFQFKDDRFIISTKNFENKETVDELIDESFEETVEETIKKRGRKKRG